MASHQKKRQMQRTASLLWLILTRVMPAHTAGFNRRVSSWVEGILCRIFRCKGCLIATAYINSTNTHIKTRENKFKTTLVEIMEVIITLK